MKDPTEYRRIALARGRQARTLGFYGLAGSALAGLCVFPLGDAKALYAFFGGWGTLIVVMAFFRAASELNFHLEKKALRKRSRPTSDERYGG